MAREGDTRSVSAELIFAYQEPDPSVGINGGWYLTAIDEDEDE